MRVILITFVVVLLAAGGFVYFTNPEGCAIVFARVRDGLMNIFYPAPAPTVVEQAQPTKPPWAPPAIIPAQPNWTWTTQQGVYKNVRILKIEADCVTIMDDEGGSLIRIADLPDQLQEQLNYDPDAAKIAEARRYANDRASVKVLENERSTAPGAFDENMEDYPAALAQAKATGQRMLLYFTGSDWCPYCQNLDSEVIATNAFQVFSGQHFIFVKVDFPHNFALPDNIKQQNDGLAKQYGISSYPTLVVVDSNEKQIGTVSGYTPGAGPDTVINSLKNYAK